MRGSLPKKRLGGLSSTTNTPGSRYRRNGSCRQSSSESAAVAKVACTDDEFVQLWNETGGKLQAFMDRFGFSGYRTVCQRRKAIEKKRGVQLMSASPISTRNATLKRKNSRRIELQITDGVILVGSDAHVWPGPLTTAQRGFIELSKRLKPDVVVMNGDVFDGAKISRHPAGIWDQEKRPGVK